MKHQIKEKLTAIKEHPKTKEAVQSLKPEKSVWGILGVIVFFIVPEIIAFIWGGEITSYAREALPLADSLVEEQYFNLLVMLFEEGGSWINLAIGIALLIWLFF